MSISILMWNLLFREITYNYLPDIMWPPENSAYFPKIKHMYVIPSVEIGVQPKCHGELSTFNSPQEESDIWYSGNCATKTDGETGRLSRLASFPTRPQWFQKQSKSRDLSRDLMTSGWSGQNVAGFWRSNTWTFMS